MIDGRNVLKNKAHPNSQSMQETPRRRGLHLAEDKKQSLQVFDNSNEDHLEISGYPGTGKYVVVEAIVEEIRRRGTNNEAVLLAMPSRNLRGGSLDEFDGEVASRCSARWHRVPCMMQIE